jgi:hypothetical protein
VRASTSGLRRMRSGRSVSGVDMWPSLNLTATYMKQDFAKSYVKVSAVNDMTFFAPEMSRRAR